MPEIAHPLLMQNQPTNVAINEDGDIVAGKQASEGDGGARFSQGLFVPPSMQLGPKPSRKAVEALVQTIETKETDGGNVAMFSRSAPQSPVTNALSSPKVQGIVNAIKSAWKNAPNVAVVDSLEDARVPKSVRDDAANSQDAGAVEGFYHDGTVYLVTNQLASAKDVARVLLHEAIGHHGLRGVFGDALTKVLNQINAFRRQAVQDKIKEYGLDAKNPAHVLQAAEEVLAEMAQTNPQIGFVRTAIAAIRTWLREHGFGSMAMSDDEIVRNIIAPARGFVERGQGSSQSDTRYSRSMTNNDVVGNTQGGRSADDSTPSERAAQQIIDAIEHDDDAYADYALRIIPGEFDGEI